MFKSKLPVVARVLLGLAFVVFGINYFVPFIPMGAPDPKVLPFMGGLMASGYVFPVIKTIEIVAGLALLGGRFVPLALTLLAPILVNIVLVHLVLAPAGAPVALALLALEIYLAWSYRAAFAPMLRARVEPNVAAVPADTRPLRSVGAAAA